MDDYLFLFAGVICAGTGGEFFVRGTVGIAHWARLSPGIIGATVAAFATSSPELTVSVNASLAGTPQIALGDALGSNVVNIALILGIGLSIAGIHSPRDSVKRDFPVALSVPAVTGILAFDGTISRFDGFLLLSMFIAWLIAVVIEARKQRSAADAVLGEHRGWLAALLSIVGLVLLVAAGRLIVAGATGIAASFGIDAFVIGATIVAIGTSAPELATTIIAKLRRHDEVALGTILGSNIFNGLLIIAIASLISPITVAWREAATALAIGMLSLVCIVPSRGGFIERRRGALLLVLYAVYLTVIVKYQ
ncbi:MAG: sodium:calcium antiporter [Desulfobacterales bacterium GWB2_56_26]|nr:MAG: sodium:calcium antiporter [Desulfobacterales bacterium GWB2_56_26]